MLTLFVVPSGKPNADFDKTVESLKRSGVKLEAVLVKCWREINAFRNKGEWYCVFWDNEGIDDGLQKALKYHLSNRVPEVLVLYKKIGDKKAEFRTRFMRGKIWLTENFKPVSPWIIHETVLDGWVVDHGIDDKR